MNTVDTIAAPASAVGGAVTVIRISGPESLQVLQKVWQGKNDPGKESNHRKMLLGKVNGDPALAVFMPGPKSYTGDDVAELHCHGGAAAAANAINAIFSAGARSAEPGEFTFRAFVNGKLDLTQAEAVSDLISAGSDAAFKLAERQLAGSLSEKLNSVYDSISSLISECEARLDFPDEDLDFDPRDAEKIAEIRQEIKTLLDSGRAGALLRDGIDVVLAGKPNAGKSSLFNLLAGSERAIVTPIPGTTRDTVESQIVLCDLPVKLTDTAGLRESSDPVEQLGVARSRRAIAAAKVIFWILDSSNPDLQSEIAEMEFAPGTIAVWNKIDLLLPGTELPQLPCPAVRISVAENSNIDALLKSFTDMIYGEGENARIPEVAVNARSQALLEESDVALLQAMEQFAPGEFELAASDLRNAMHTVGKITGKSSDPDILDEIFRNFCIGK
ncbi:MAG: tRNA uridine-5-carboxymethylaminomethyl(34) synthesis GTPase MnmE [Lentisphaeria bacterium]|nr:tRNA uridine-5-carboxymethylaminomethyl(34) synthesis GTPase MnmE [Lentisphaeria bacterium]